MRLQNDQHLTAILQRSHDSGTVHKRQPPKILRGRWSRQAVEWIQVRADHNQNLAVVDLEDLHNYDGLYII